MHIGVSNNEGEGKLEINFVDFATIFQAISMKAALLGDLAESSKSSMQTPMEILTFVEGGCRVFVQGC